MEGLFKHTLKTIDNEGFIHRNKSSEKDFIRKRKLSFRNLVVSLLCFTRPSINTEMDRFFKAISNTSNQIQSLSKSAFSQARKKLKLECFIELNNTILSYFIENAPCPKTWKGKRVVAVDGSSLNLPNCNELKEDFGCTSNQYDEIIRAKCSFAYDVCNELILDAQIDTIKTGEEELAVRHLKNLNPQTDILVFDRGYPGHWFIGFLINHGYKFCFRLSKSWKDGVDLANSDKSDVDWVMKWRSNRAVRKLKKDNIPLAIDGLRLVCIELPSGEKEILATNLTDRNTYTIEDLKELYHMRWSVEECYKLFKKVLHIEHFTGKTSLAIKQDFFAKVFTLNLSSMIRLQGVVIAHKSKRKLKHKRQTNKTQAIAKTKDFLIDLFYSCDIRTLINKLISLISNKTDIIRTGRSFPRSDSSIRRRHKTLNYKGI